MTNDTTTDHTGGAGDPVFEPPGPGCWQLDRSHYGGGTTPIAQWLQVSTTTPAFRRGFAELGIPADTLASAFVNGFMYTRLRPLVRPDAPATKLPPPVVLKAVSRLHPAFRRRTRTAARAVEQRPWRRVIEDWHARTKPELVATNLGLGAVDLAALDDVALAAHVERLLAHARDAVELHFWLHNYDLGPIGLLLADSARWGLPSDDVIAALEGASPSSGAAGRALAAIGDCVRSSPVPPRNLGDVRAISPDAAERLDEYLRLRGDLLVTRYDLDGATLRELPDLVLATVLEAAGPDGGGTHGPAEGSGTTAADRAEAAAAGLRARLQEQDRASFDERLAEARAAMDLRDDNGPNTVQWPMGLLRLALVEAGRRLHDRGLVADPAHVVELQPDEVAVLVGSGSGPSPEVLAARAARRARDAGLEPPPTLGPPEPEPPLELLPPPLQLMVGAVQAVLAQLGMTARERPDPLRGAGVGTTAYRGRARRATSAEEALDAMEPGDVLVVPFTTPSYNTVLGLAGAVVTSEGGPLCHAAVLARELGIPAVIGAPGALVDIPDGAEVEVDPRQGRVTVLHGAGPLAATR